MQSLGYNQNDKHSPNDRDTFKKYFSGWKTLGIDPTTEFAEVAEENSINVIYGYLKKGIFKEKFDLITLIHVLEHIGNLEEMLLILKSYLKRDGFLYIEVPSVKDIGYLPNSHDRFMCQHEIIFSKDVLDMILTKLNYSIVVSENFFSIRGRNNLRTLIKNK